MKKFFTAQICGKKAARQDRFGLKQRTVKAKHERFTSALDEWFVLRSLLLGGFSQNLVATLGSIAGVSSGKFTEKTKKGMKSSVFRLYSFLHRFTAANNYGYPL
ncbi:MAG: hypothetical protein FWE27_04475 [Defluviitaleaceae bacterium]|nr:hypothetical protein [Defluviitaleaceae bacterium]